MSVFEQFQRLLWVIAMSDLKAHRQIVLQIISKIPSRSDVAYLRRVSSLLAETLVTQGVSLMRSLIVIAVVLSILIPSAFAQSNSITDKSDRAAAAKRETADLEKARLIEQLRHSNLRMQAQQKELEKLAQQQEDEPAPGQTPDLQSIEQQHPEWFRETNKYKPCPWNMCPSPPSR
jgi:hypothetical protein